MSTYKNLIGKDVNFLSTDPDNSQAEGQIWYNSTAGAFKDLIVGEAWSSSSPLLNPGYAMGGAGASQTDGMIFGGQNPGGQLATTNEYNGNGFSAGGNLVTARNNLGGAGTVPAGLAFGGRTSPTAFRNESEEYDGSSWSEGNNLNTARADAGGAGTQTAALFVGGFSNPPATQHNQVEQYNGTSWSETGNDYPVSAYGIEGAGTQTAALMAGGTPGSPPYAPGLTTEYDGSTFTTAATMGTAAYNAGMFGTQTSAIYAGGVNNSSSPIATSQKYDGTTWTATPSLASSRNALAAFGADATAGLMGGGVPVTDTTQEFTRTINTVIAAAWASGGTLPSPGRQGYGVGTGTQTASIIAGGPPDSTQNQFYDGASWTNLASIPTGATNSQGFGDSEELLMAGGNTGAPYSALTYVYSRPGNSWTAVSSPGNINTARALGAGCGALSTAGIIAGGDVPSYTTATENWNGSSWTTVNALPTATGNGVGSCGTQTAGLIWSGENPGDPTAEETYEWDGTNWTSSGNRIIGVRAVRGGAGTQTAALTFGGWLDPGGSVSTEGYDGTSWSTRPNMAGAAANNFQTGTQTAALRAGGTDGPGYTAVEEFTGETTALNIKTITTS